MIISFVLYSKIINKIVILGETHVKNNEIFEKCNKLIDKFQCIGYENCKVFSLLYHITRKLRSYFYDRPSSVHSNKVLLGIAQKHIAENSILEKNEFLEVCQIKYQQYD